MKEQIEEMAKSVDEALIHNVSWNSNNGVIAYSAEGIARELFDDGYRKQKEGEWIAKDNFNGRCSIATCSNCGIEKAFAALVKPETIAELYPYCQKCGAKMKGGAD